MICKFILLLGIQHSHLVFLLIILHHRLLEGSGYNSLCHAVYPCCLSLLWAFLACVLSRFSCVRLCNPMDCSPPGSSIHGILQARILEWVAMPSSRGFSQPRDRTLVFCIADRFFTTQRLGKLLQSFSVWNVWFEVTFQPKLSTLHEVICIRFFSALLLHC